MANSNNRLRNMTFNQTFESSLVQKSNEKFSIDKSLVKGIKQNDVTKIIDKNQLSGTNQNKQIYDEYKQVEGIVVETRKRYDNQKTKSTKAQQQIQKLKKQKQLLLEDQAKYTAIIDKHKRQLEQSTRKLEQVSALMQSTIYRKDIYVNVKENIKFDLLVLKKRYFDKDVKLLRDSTKLKTIKNQHEAKISLSRKCRDMLGSVQKTAHEKQLQRTSKIQSFCQVINKRQLSQQNRQIRQREIQQAMISAMTDKLSEQKQWIRMFNTNLFLKGLLRAKMQRLMERYNKIQLSFHKIKQSTSLKDSNQFIQRFLTREQTYGLLLESISQKQRQLQEIKQQRDQLQKINQSYLYRGEQMQDQKKKSQPKSKTLDELEVRNPNSALHKINSCIEQISRNKQLFYQWATRFLAAFYQHKNKDQITKKYPKSKFKQLFIQVLAEIKKSVTEITTKQNHEQKIEQSFLKNNPTKQNFMSGQTFERNTRIKTFSGFENEGDAFEDKDMMYDDISETDYLQHNRRTIKKNDQYNRKFRIKTKPN